ncbi:unnamed protein product [Dracunculus medinensis]|uniref:Metalloendopeptidase n=1 Tax=Dracunculus medinensis TaxID=318479 RepID=A0A0N4U0S0_DRAME|nr:unnamed protein product [Dracunculus medinensis]
MLMRAARKDTMLFDCVWRGQMQSDGVGTNCGSIQTTVVAPKGVFSKKEIYSFKYFRLNDIHDELRYCDK